MDLFFVVMPSILFALLQHTSNTHATKVKSIKKKMEKNFKKNSVDKNELQGGKVKRNMDFIDAGAVEPKDAGIALIWGFTVYLALIALFHVLNVEEWHFNVFGLNDKLGLNDNGSKNSQESYLMITPRLLYVYMLCLAYMFCLVGATCYQILWSFPRENNKYVNSYLVVDACIESASRSGEEKV